MPRTVPPIAAGCAAVPVDLTSPSSKASLLLEREGYRVVTAANGAEGLTLAKVEQPDVILLDVIMPNMDGYETLRRLMMDPDTKGIPVIMVTAKTTERAIATSFQLGAVSYVEKPYETQDLLQKIQAALAQKIH